MKIPNDIRRYVRKRRFLRVALWLLCMMLFSFAFFSSWDSISESIYTEIRVVIFIGVLVVSIFIFRIPKLFFEKSDRGGRGSFAVSLQGSFRNGKTRGSGY